MTYNQVQSFQINDFVNHYMGIEVTRYYMDIEITEYRVQYSKSIADSGIAKLISCWAQQLS